MMYAKKGLCFDWGIDEDMVWIIDKAEGRPAQVYMEEVLNMLKTQIGTCKGINIIYKSLLGRWDAVIALNDYCGYEFRALGNVSSYAEAKYAMNKLFGVGTKIEVNDELYAMPREESRGTSSHHELVGSMG